MATAIRPKIVTKGKQHNEFAKRYIFYPLHNLNLANSQWESPVWNPKIPKGRIVLLEACEYQTQVVGEGEQLSGSNGVQLGERMMGTDAQVRFLMGNTDGTGWMDKGMTNLDSLVDVDPQTVMEIEEILIPNGEVPEDLIAFDAHLKSLSIVEDNPVSALAAKARLEMHEGVTRAINWCKTYTNQLEQELKDGQNGGFGLKFLSETNKYYFNQIRKSLPEDREGTNMGNELAKVLAPLLQQAGGNIPPAESPNLQSTIEMEELKKKLAAAEATNKEQEEVIATLTEQPNEA